MIAAIATSVLLPYSSNANTGNLYEIVVALDLLRRMGLTDADLDSLAELQAAIVARNAKKAAEITAAFATVRTKPVGSGLLFDGKTIVEIKNVTQDDSAGCTGDLLLIDSTGATHSLSITGGKAKGRAAALTIEKCLSNPTAERFGCTAEDIAEFKAIGLATVPKYKDEMTAKYGAEETAWSRKPSAAAVEACADVAARTAIRYASFDAERQLAIFKDLLRIVGDGKPADYLGLVHPEKHTVSFYEFSACLVSAWAPRLEAHGIYIHFFADASHKIGTTQVKFNNGVWHKGKTSSIHSSWNATFNLTDLFRMRAVTLA